MYPNIKQEKQVAKTLSTPGQSLVHTESRCKVKPRVEKGSADIKRKIFPKNSFTSIT